MPPGHIAGHLKNVLEAENVPFESSALSLLARAAAGSMRDALSLTDQAIAYCTGEVKEAETRAMLGVIDQAYLLPVLEALAALDGPRLMHEAAELAARGFSFDAALQDLAGLLHQIALAQSVPEAVAEDLPERDRLFDLARQLDPESVQLHYQIATLGRRDLEWAPDEYAGFSMTLLRMLAFAPGDAPGDAPAARAPAPLSNPAKDSATPARSAAAALSAATAASTAIPPRVQVALAAAVNEPAANEPIAPSQVTPAAATLATSSEWRPLAESLPGLVRQLAMQCEQIERTDVLLRLRLPEGQKALLASVGDKLRAALAEKLGSAVKVEIDLVADVANYSRQSPAAERAREQAVRQSEAESAIHNDPFIQTLVRECDATLTNIRPRTASAG
jgi:DNA polymerase-3 subunit gamma/tau